MEDRNVLRRMERERRNQEVQQQEETRYDRIAPLFSEPYKIDKSDELSARIQMMLGNFEDGRDVGPQELVFPFSDSTRLSPLQNSWGRTDGSTASGENLPLLYPPAEPLSPLQPSDVDDMSPEGRRGGPSQMEALPLAPTLPLNLHHKVGLLNSKKPTAYVRPMDGQDQMTSGSPDFKTSPETNEHLPDLKNSDSPKHPFERPPQSVDQNLKSPCHDIRPDSHQSPGRTEAEDQQGRSHNPTHGDTESNHTQTAKSTRLENSQHNKITSTRRTKENGKKTDERRATDPSVCSTKHTDREFTRRPLLVKIELKLLSRIPQEPRTPAFQSGVTERPDPQKIPPRKRPVERDGTSSMKKRRTDKEERRSSSSQNTTSQSEVTKSRGSMKKRKHQKPVPPDSRQQKSEAHGKKTQKSHDVPARPPATKPRTLLQLDHRQRSVEDHMREAKKLKHKADATMDKMSKALSYLEAALSFMESGVAMESDTQMPRSAYTMFSETLELIRFILKLKNYSDPTAAAHERDFLVLCLRCEAMLQMAMFRYGRDSALKHSRTLAEHFKPIHQVAASYVEVTALFLNALERWEQADEVALRGSGLLRELDAVVAPLSLTSSMSSLVQYTRHGLHWIRLQP
ncbi:AF4/FMR2 family member 4 ALL1-fused gene from chromosome 5q31 protein [Triplophysa tibetana]|uniref:AF4/FMR2 family member 4 ALL1-fused gene from chromosome 5q31 protein n=1 Tax=Triplophysa tibetana TaxID=1572043 RepID=A0A5A9PFE6_9TELE|nr:AF4/FMR2 family member 4 ALL1-fused gene from chromosome 5q31 protein [Triplophysa tibetana]